MKHVNCFPKLCDTHGTIGPTRIVCTHLPNRLGKTPQDLRAFMLLPICAWYKAKPSFCRTVGGKPVSRSSESTSQINLRGCSDFSGTNDIHCMPKLAYSDCRELHATHFASNYMRFRHARVPLGVRQCSQWLAFFLRLACCCP